VELTESFSNRLSAIELFLTQADAMPTFDKLLAGLRTKVIPNLRRFPLTSRRYLDQPPQSAEALVQLAALPAGAADKLREYLHGDYLVLYTVLQDQSVAYLLSIRRHRQPAFKFERPEFGE
jgi:ParE toxin of type II toxin-antitoxin system, parDE